MKSKEEIRRNAAFWERFKKLCKEKKITQVELCDKTGIDKGKLQGQITRDISPMIFDCQKMAECLGVSMEYLVTGKEQKSKETESLVADISAILEKYKQR